MQLIRKNIYNVRRKIILKIPSNLIEVHEFLENKVIVTVEKDNFVLENNTAKEI